MSTETITPAMKKAIRLQITRTWQYFHRNFIRTQLPSDLIPEVRISLPVLHEAIDHAFIDIDRMAKWHLPEHDRRPDRHKWSGFSAKWVAKMRPIYCAKPGMSVRALPLINILNAHFALYIFRCFLYCKEGVYHEPLSKNVLYALHYRDLTGETLALLAYSYETIVDFTPLPQPSS